MIYVIIVNGPEPRQGCQDFRYIFTDRDEAYSTFGHMPLAPDEPSS